MLEIDAKWTVSYHLVLNEVTEHISKARRDQVGGVAQEDRASNRLAISLIFVLIDFILWDGVVDQTPLDLIRFS